MMNHAVRGNDRLLGAFFCCLKKSPQKRAVIDFSTFRSRRVSATRVSAFFLDGAIFLMDFQ